MTNPPPTETVSFQVMKKACQSTLTSCLDPLSTISANVLSECSSTVPWVPEVSCGPLRDLPAEGRRPTIARVTIETLTETGNHARQTSGTQGMSTASIIKNSTCGCMDTRLTGLPSINSGFTSILRFSKV